METILHTYHPSRRLLLLEYINRSPHSTATPFAASPISSSPPNVLLFIGGLYDNFHSPTYPDDLASLFPRDAPDQKWRVMHVQLSTNGRSWGLFDLDRDVSSINSLINSADVDIPPLQVQEISVAIDYIRNSITQSPSTPVVLMGHSTGCQDIMHYLVSPVSSKGRATISGAILQAAVSDREAMMHSVQTEPKTKAAYETALSIAASTPKEKHKTTILPMDVSVPVLGPSPVNVARFLSLASPDSPAHPSMDDYYSSDLSEQRLRDTFGRISSVSHFQSPSSRSMMILLSGSDEAMPAWVDKALLLSRWKAAVESTTTSLPTSSPVTLFPSSQVIPHALHDISGSSHEARTARLIIMRSAVLRYLADVVGDISHEPQGPWAIFEHDRRLIEGENSNPQPGPSGRL